MAIQVAGAGGPRRFLELQGSRLDLLTVFLTRTSRRVDSRVADWENALLLLSSRHRGSVLFAHLLSCSDWLRQRRSARGGVVSNGCPREPASARASDWQAWAGPSIVLSANRPLAMVSKVSEISEMNYRSSSRYPFLSPNQPSGSISRNRSIIFSPDRSMQHGSTIKCGIAIAAAAA